MTYVSDRRSVPAQFLFEAKPLAGKPHRIELPVKGQGTLAFAVADNKAPFVLTFGSAMAGAPVLRWEVDAGGARLSEYRGEQWQQRAVFGPEAGLDPEPACSYWFSVDGSNRALIYGKGEMRLGTAVGKWDFPPKPEKGDDPYGWVRQVSFVALEAELAEDAEMWRDPVVVDPPMYVVGHDQIGMDDIGAGIVTVPANLSQRCQQLYDAVAGAMFQLDTPDFRHFADAIAASIDNPAGWCAWKLRQKAQAGEFGPDPTATYLRITLGRSQGESPGIPYVMEIWPSGHHSPIHDHAGADAVIRVLHGQIKVSLYPMLSQHHETPFAVKRFDKGDVTWISARLNQIHKLENDHPDPCITIQCYMYDLTNEVHWPYFDFIGGEGIGLYDPDSDADFDWFKARMREEWLKPPTQVPDA